MTEQQTPPTTGAHRQVPDAGGPLDLRPSAQDDALLGWVRFGAVMMTIVGAFGVIEGLVALVNPITYVTVDGAVLAVDLTAWGWAHLVLGALLVVTGVSLLRTAPAWARSLGVVLVVLSILVQLAWLPASPIWSILVIVLDLLVIYALVATSPRR
jgi:hypothetical protein